MWPSFVLVLVVGVIPLGSLLIDREPFTDIAGRWSLVSKQNPKDRFVSKFEIEPEGIVTGRGLVGRELCWQRCFVFHDIKGRRSYSLVLSEDGQSLTITGIEPRTAAAVARKITP